MRDQHFHFGQVIGQRPFIIALSQRQFAQQRGSHRFIGAQEPNQTGALFVTQAGAFLCKTDIDRAILLRMVSRPAGRKP